MRERHKRRDNHLIKRLRELMAENGEAEHL